jgi:hypothetical protein
LDTGEFLSTQKAMTDMTGVPWMSRPGIERMPSSTILEVFMISLRNAEDGDHHGARVGARGRAS